MSNLYARAVFFTDDAERSLRFYTEQLGLSVDWTYDEDGKAFVFQVSLLGFELILNQTEGPTVGRAGHGRVFIGLDDDQREPFRQHLLSKGVKPGRVDWGRPTPMLTAADSD